MFYEKMERKRIPNGSGKCLLPKELKLRQISLKLTKTVYILTTAAQRRDNHHNRTSGVRATCCAAKRPQRLQVQQYNLNKLHSQQIK